MDRGIPSWLRRVTKLDRRLLVLQPGLDPCADLLAAAQYARRARLVDAINESDFGVGGRERELCGGVALLECTLQLAEVEGAGGCRGHGAVSLSCQWLCGPPNIDGNHTAGLRCRES